VITVLSAYGLTQGQISGMTGISQGRLSEWVTCKREPRASSTFESFADGLGMPLAAGQTLGLASGVAAASGMSLVRSREVPDLDSGLAYPARRGRLREMSRCCGEPTWPIRGCSSAG
jgi:transcriptional regulator with XRE-family HTH domain